MSLKKKRGKHVRSASESSETVALPAQENSIADSESADSAETTPLAFNARETAALSSLPAIEHAPVAGDVPPTSAQTTEALAYVPVVPAPEASGAASPELASAPIGQNDLGGFDVAAPEFVPAVEGAAPDAYVSAFDVPARKKRNGLKVFGITMGVLLGVLLLAYIVGAVVFMGRFLPNTFVGDRDISMRSDAEVVQALEEMADSYQLDVVGGSFSYRTSSSQVGVSIDGQAVVKAMHDDLNPWTWPVLIFQPKHDESALLVATYDKAALEADFTEKLKSYNESAKAPVNATIVYNEKKKSYDVKPEEAGTQWNQESVLIAVEEAASALEGKLSLSEDMLVQPTVFSTDERLIESAQIATGLVSADLVLNMGGQRVGEVNGEALSGFVTIDDKLDVTFNEEALDEWVQELAEGYNTIGTERSYTRADGKQIVVRGGSYGWEIDTDALREELINGIKAGAKSEIEVPCFSTAAVYNGLGQPDWGARYIDVDISEQYVRFYGDDGSIIWETPCISGSPDGKHDTVPGVWYVNNMESPSKLIGYEDGKKIYETTVTYWMAFESSEIGLHDASWQPSFGGSMYAQGYGSHGCVNLPVDKARELYGICNIGDVVIVHD